MNSGFWKQNIIAILALAFVLILGVRSLTKTSEAKKIAFVDTQRLMTGFKEANKVNKEVEAEDGKWRTALKAMEDSLKSYMDTMSVKYDRADAKTKKEMQDELSLKNQQVNNFEKVNTRKMQELTNEKMTAVYQKINAFMKEYGAARHFDIIFGTAQGSILYGDGTPADITSDIIGLLNKRYE